MESFIHVIILIMLVTTAITIVRVKDLFAVTMLAGIYGLLSASFFVLMDAHDVAFTEAAVGAGISTLLILTTLSMTGRFEKAATKPQANYRPLLALALVTLTGALLIYGTQDMPAFGAADAPVQTHVVPRYLNDSATEIDIPNVVASVLASYRGYDTFGEVVVIFTAGIGVLALIMSTVSKVPVARTASMNDHVVLRIVSKMLIPLILIFGLYVQFHGEYGPGGGFQAGVIFASAFFLYAMLFGLTAARKVVNNTLVQLLAAVGVLLYGSVGLLSMINGGNFLDYNFLAQDDVHGQHMGILFVELGVGITVASVMIIIFFTFSTRSQKDGDPD
ncbi:MAG: Na(+)/H(+) antiporter subunit B [Gammaproteobacteria bacterium]|nr:Na(+)/H(+) antiporter subunit B [Gammaproteobacteria bacterium]